MTDNNYEPERYQYASVAAQFLKNKDVKSAGKSLEKMAIEGGMSEDLLPLMKGTTTNPREVEDAIEDYNGRYEKLLGKKNITYMFDKYEPIFTDYLGEDNKNILKEDFDKIKKETYGDVQNKFEKAMEIIESETGNFSEEQKEEAVKILKKYGEVYSIIKQFNQLYIEDLMKPISKKTIRGNFEEHKRKQAANNLE
ncbi:hypothetical protein CMI40_01315 [Candidatus Pacearchaeota archaeon]|jgi:hypothetical protein|nr:hypothetical protein [Candidatus Pacearchaeota archaeon]|tara:strand:+ start:3064 stop:3651 length:588 start_codon:yes stop_codon:yes gene_type:complete